MKKCSICGCPQLFWLDGQLHYKGCTAKNLLDRRRKIRFDFIATVKTKISDLKEALREIDVEKIICLDEVYECRWDCSILGVAHPIQHAKINVRSCNVE